MLPGMRHIPYQNRMTESGNNLLHWFAIPHGLQPPEIGYTAGHPQGQRVALDS